MASAAVAAAAAAAALVSSPPLLPALGAPVPLLLAGGAKAAADEASGRRSDTEGILVAAAGFAPCCCCCCCMADMFPAVCPAGSSCTAHAWLAEVAAAASGSAVAAVGTKQLSLMACLGCFGTLLLLLGAGWLLLLLLLLLGVLPFRSATARENSGPPGTLCAGGRAVGLLPKLLLRDAAALFVKEEVPEEVPDTAPASAAGEDVAGSGDALDAFPALCCCAGMACSESRSAAEDAVLLGLEQHRSTSSSSLSQSPGSLLPCSDMLVTVVMCAAC